MSLTSYDGQALKIFGDLGCSYSYPDQHHLDLIFLIKICHVHLDHPKLIKVIYKLSAQIDRNLSETGIPFMSTGYCILRKCITGGHSSGM